MKQANHIAPARHRMWRTLAGKQAGAALVITLVFLVAIMMVGLYTAYSARQEERFARAGRDNALAKEGAESALRYVEAQIASGTITYNGTFATYPATNSNGRFVGTSTPMITQLSLSNVVKQADGYTTAIPATAWAAPYSAMQTPRYIVESFADLRSGTDLSGETVQRMYRITAWGFGLNNNVVSVLESVYEPQ